MFKPICRDVFFLQQKSEAAGEEDRQVVQDLMDTLAAHRDGCVGMAANMIGVAKRIIVVSIGPINVPMINPVITQKSGAFETEEGCLSLTGTRKTTRYQEIEVEYLNSDFQKVTRKYSGWTAQIIQHEVDHCEGIII